MSSLGRFFEFRQSPIPQHRLGRFKTGADPIVQGAPVTATATSRDSVDLREVIALAGEGTAFVPGLSGLLVWEAPWDWAWGHDPVTYRPSDVDTAPAHTPVQVVHGTEVRIALHNIAASDGTDGFMAYAGRNMVKPADLAVPLVVGDKLTPGAGNGTTGGFWKKTTNTDATAWLTVTGVDLTIGEVEAQLRF